MRYVNLSNILVMRQISVKVERQFPDNQALLDAKLLRAPEALRLEKIDAKTPHESRCFWLIFQEVSVVYKIKAQKLSIKNSPEFKANMLHYNAYLHLQLDSSSLGNEITG